MEPEVGYGETEIYYVLRRRHLAFNIQNVIHHTVQATAEFVSAGISDSQLPGGVAT